MKPLTASCSREAAVAKPGGLVFQGQNGHQHRPLGQTEATLAIPPRVPWRRKTVELGLSQAGSWEAQECWRLIRGCQGEAAIGQGLWQLLGGRGTGRAGVSALSRPGEEPEQGFAFPAWRGRGGGAQTSSREIPGPFKGLEGGAGLALRLHQPRSPFQSQINPVLWASQSL